MALTPDRNQRKALALTLSDIIARLTREGNVVTADPIIPGLYRVNGGPELTAGQMRDVYGDKPWLRLKT